ncbi:RsmB/NOP family class I SAM-dependent RNA methyltransferase [Candidatus Woesearchaeota archaeon]|nr:RsmB/NOP family class I SAM-dependent RNA methyltransferase [Candidatus Woesearchaeota archaeon]
MKDTSQIEFKAKFIERYKKLTDWEEFKKYSLTWLRRSIRVNTLKISVPELKKRLEKVWELTPIPWCKEGFWIKHKTTDRRDIGNLTEHSLGYFYVQEAVSMIPPIVLDPKPGEKVLDMCAAPGSKSSQIAQYMQNKGVLISNDYKGIRLAPLGINMQRMGITNAILTLMEGRFFKGFEFDKILVDAPCSGTGTIRKSFKTIRIWNANMVRRLAGAQKQLISVAFENLKSGGTMVYSTCSDEPEEDEEVISYLLEKYDNAKLEEIKLDINRSEPILEFENKKYNPEVKKCLRLWPQDNDTEGFFVTKIRKL